VVTAAPLVGATFWDILGSFGFRVGVITVPVTYPPWEVNGFMLSGYPCPDVKRNYTYPPEWGEGLKESYNLSVDHYLHASEEEIIAAGLDLLQRRTSLAIDLSRKEGLEVCVLVLGEIDRAQHDFWKYVDPRFPAYHSPQGGRYRGVIAEHYQVCDAQIGRLLECVTEETMVIIMSDHGAGPHPERCFLTNAWLREQGLLSLRTGGSGLVERGFKGLLSLAREAIPFEEGLRRALPPGVVQRLREVNLGVSQIDWGRTKAYRFPMYHPAEGIEINLRGRQPQGMVEPGEEYEALRASIIEALKGLRDPEDGRPIVKEVYRREELYRGPYLEIAPDIVFISPYKAEGGVEERYLPPVPLGRLTKKSGVHHLEGVFLAQGEGIKKGAKLEEAEIIDLAPTILYALGAPIPAEMDGKVLLQIFEPAYLSSRQPRYLEGKVEARMAGSRLSPQEEEEIKDKLRGLGYIS
jgi:predicted AlkP superfamily phosphohydrolase/phosphomutase